MRSTRRYNQKSNRRQAGILAYVGQITVANLVIGACLAASVVGYLVMNTQAATRGFVIKSMEREIGELEDKQKELDSAVAVSQAMDKVQQMVKEKGFVPAAAPEFIGSASGPVAVR